MKDAWPGGWAASFPGPFPARSALAAFYRWERLRQEVPSPHPAVGPSTVPQDSFNPRKSSWASSLCSPGLWLIPAASADPHQAVFLTCETGINSLSRLDRWAVCPSAHQAACAWLWCVAGVGEQLWAGWLAPRPEGRESCGKALGNVIYNQSLLGKGLA